MKLVMLELNSSKLFFERRRGIEEDDEAWYLHVRFCIMGTNSLRETPSVFPNYFNTNLCYKNHAKFMGS
jgi:hypothetical protein